MKNLILFFLISSAHALVPKEVIDQNLNKDPLLGMVYQQQEYQLVDFQGDYSMLALAKDNIAWLKARVKRDKKAMAEIEKAHVEAFEKNKNLFPQWQFNSMDPNPESLVLTDERINSFDVSEEAKELLRQNVLNKDFGFELPSKPIHSKKLINMLTQVIYEEHRDRGIEPKVGQEHVFSEEFRKYYKNEFPVLKTGMTKLFIALGNGLTSRFMVTGKEEELGLLFEKKNPNSITLDQAFRMSYRLNNGDVYLALLTLENIFSYHWLTPKRENINIIQRLKPFTHYFNKGDKFGHWYHFWGMVLYGFVRGGPQAWVVGKIEDSLSEWSGKEGEIQEGKVNMTGGWLGGKLKKAVLTKRHLGPWKPSEEYLKESYYLNPMDLDIAIKTKFLVK